MGVAHCPKGNEPYFRLDIEFLPEEEFAFGLLYFSRSCGRMSNIRVIAIVGCFNCLILFLQK